MSTGKTGTRYDEDFKRTLVNLYQSGGKTQAALCKVYLSRQVKRNLAKAIDFIQYIEILWYCPLVPQNF